MPIYYVSLQLILYYKGRVAVLETCDPQSLKYLFFGPLQKKKTKKERKAEP